ncbi:MAG: replication factor C large subunit [Methanomicrobiales archaeon]|nr:replication factor C large subunit [Methanomicrobiales archaeon]
MEWTEKYRPQHLNDLVGNTQVLQQMITWARSWTPRSRPLLLYGRPGTGKTSSAHALARDMAWDLIEMNASDQRTKAVLERVAGTSAVTASLSGARQKLILLDEVDNLHGSADRGGARALLEIIPRSRQPIILIANTLQDVPAELRATCEPLLFRAIQGRSILPRLKYICTEEKVRCSEAALREIADRAGGDVRAAVTMLHAAAVGKSSITEEDIHSSPKDERSTIFDLVGGVFRGRPDRDLLRLAQNSGEAPDAIVQWLEGSIRHLHDRRSMVQAYRCIARADRYLGRTLRRQYYTLWRYVQALALIGMSGAAGRKGIHTRISPPSRWQHLGSSRRQRAVRGALLHRLSFTLHIPEQILREEYITLLTHLVERTPGTYVTTLGLDTDELTFFLHDRGRAAAIMKEVQEAIKEKDRSAPPAIKRQNQGPVQQTTLF